MRIANHAGRTALLSETNALDIHSASGGRFPADPRDLWRHWESLIPWANQFSVDGHPDAHPYSAQQLRAPVPAPSQVFAIGLNYIDHAKETALAVPDNPLVFTKFPSALTGPDSIVQLSGPRVDWEAELVVVIGRGGRDVPQGRAWDAVAGLMVGQDLSDRTVQNWGDPAQFNLGKSFAGYAPTGPAVVTLDEVRQVADPDALRIQCSVADQPGGPRRMLQDASTADLIFPIPEIIARLSTIVDLQPGDLLFTGTPAGVGMGREPQEFLHAGQELITRIEALGSIRQTFAN